MKRHKRSKAYSYPPGAREFCEVCGAVRQWAFPSYYSSGWRLKGYAQPFCDGESLKDKKRL